MSLTECPICGHDVAEKEVEKILRGGNNTAVVKVKAEVCLHGGERLYSRETVTLFERIRAKREQQQTAGWQQVGLAYRVS
jgi:YgiT-type zinc finger domain-containing protein